MFTFYEVGGCVRDQLLGIPSKDIDYVAVAKETEGYSANIIFEDLRLFLENEKYEIFLVTPNCYTIRAKFPKTHANAGIVADFVLARKEIGYKVGTREPEIVPGTLYDDLIRRDFTVNAIAKSETGELIDPFNGRRDLQDGVLNTPIRGKITFGDDPLRLLRAIRFAVTKKFSIGSEVHEILMRFDYDENFKVVSEERIREELHKALKCNTLRTLEYLTIYGRLRKYIFSRTNIWLRPTTEL